MVIRNCLNGEVAGDTAVHSLPPSTPPPQLHAFSSTEEQEWVDSLYTDVWSDPLYFM